MTFVDSGKERKKKETKKQKKDNEWGGGHTSLEDWDTCVHIVLRNDATIFVLVCAPHTLVDVHQCNGDGVEGGTKESSKAVSKMLRSKWLVGTCVCVCAYTEDHLLHNQRRAHNNIVHYTPDWRARPSTKL